jgi:D-psicose/D-tagatose/L-ribulose 3-epimerase
MLLGFNMLLWASQLTDEHFPVLTKIKTAGYDGVELPLFGGEPKDYVSIRRELKNLGLRATGVCVIPDKEHDCTSSDPKARAGGLAHLKWAIDCLEAVGGEVLCGPFYQPLGVFSGNPPTDEERSGIVEVHKAAARYANKASITLAVEPLNRFECYALNTVADAADRETSRRAQLRPPL